MLSCKIRKKAQDIFITNIKCTFGIATARNSNFWKTNLSEELAKLVTEKYFFDSYNLLN